MPLVGFTMFRPVLYIQEESPTYKHQCVTSKSPGSHENLLSLQMKQQKVQLTEDGHDHVVFEDLDGAAGDKVKRGEHVSAVDQRVSWRCVGGLEPHGQGPQAALGGPAKRLAALQEALVEVEADVRLQALWETLQHLRVGHEANAHTDMVTTCDTHTHPHGVVVVM